MSESVGAKYPDRRSAIPERPGCSDGMAPVAVPCGSLCSQRQQIAVSGMDGIRALS